MGELALFLRSEVKDGTVPRDAIHCIAALEVSGRGQPLVTCCGTRGGAADRLHDVALMLHGVNVNNRKLLKFNGFTPKLFATCSKHKISLNY